MGLKHFFQVNDSVLYTVNSTVYLSLTAVPVLCFGHVTDLFIYADLCCIT